ncbi:MAG: HD domain-containing protein [Actinobacteria bacterium]|nr:HD domain-containing protein [Actinomycetota bacterium]MBU1944996.1 HD domain-containing protein [Actinomycetota bacterium]MBU2686668.1 HD domain-containing protein [Actinomycetota bacterium]
MNSTGSIEGDEPGVSLFEMVLALSRALDLVHPSVADHNLKVSYIATSIGRELGFTPEQQAELAIAGALHDIGALSLEERLEINEFEMEDPHRHAERGHRLLRLFEPFQGASRLVRYHHVRWDEAGNGDREEGVPIGSHVIHLADRASLFLDASREIIGQINGVLEAVRKHAGSLFHPDLVEAFATVSGREHFWFDVVSPYLGSIISEMIEIEAEPMSREELSSLAGHYSKMIDFRSHYTASHSSGVAATVRAMAGIVGLDEADSELMGVAGGLHDIGKLAVPTEILEKPGRLSRNEMNIVLAHPYFSYRILKPVSAMETVNNWGSLHHERIDGSGYPFHYGAGDLSLGSRLMAVSDVFAATLEDRPYRKGMPPAEVKTLLEGMSSARKLDGELVSVLLDDFDAMAGVREAADQKAEEAYRQVFGPESGDAGPGTS